MTWITHCAHVLPPCLGAARAGDLIARAASRSLAELRQAHAHATSTGILPRDADATTSLLLAYSSLGDHNSSLLFLRHTPRHLRRGAFLYNSLVRYLSSSSLHADAIRVYNFMLREGVAPDDRTFPFVLSACAHAASYARYKGREIHGSVVKLGFGSDVFVGNTLLTFYGSCGLLDGAIKTFDEMPFRDVVSWNSMISVLSTNGYSSDSMDWFVWLSRSGLMANSVSLISVLPACAAVGNEVFGKGVHGYAIKSGLDSEVVVGNALVDAYGKCRNMEDSIRVFTCMPERNDVSWNAIIGSFVHVGFYGGALQTFREMLASVVKPNSVTISSLLPALVVMECFKLGCEVHGYSIRNGMDSDIFVSNSLVDMYAKSGCSKKASDVFYRTRSRNAVSWNAMIANFAQNGAELEAIGLVKNMQDCGECPNSVTFTNVLPACARIASLKKGKEIHALSIRVGSYLDLFVSNALIDMYAKCGRLELARKVFDVSEKDEVSYNTLIVGYSQSLLCLGALHLFLEMSSAGLDYDVVSFMGALSACANMSALKQGREIHGLSVRKMFYTHLFVANSLLDLYTKTGRMDVAKKIFDRISNKDVASWNSMILGFGMQGDLQTAIEMFDMMKGDGVEYDHVSYIAVLSACSHGGLVKRGQKYFDNMLNQNIRPTQMHYACMVDLLGRASLMREAKEYIEGMPFEADSNVWGALLGACRIHGNIELGRWAAKHLFELKPGHCGYYIVLSNMYAEAGRWREANEIRELMKSRRMKKNPGCSWIMSGNKMHAFMVGERMEEPDLDLCNEGYS